MTGSLPVRATAPFLRSTSPMTGSAVLLSVALGSVEPLSGADGGAPEARPNVDQSSAERSERLREAWLLSLEAVTRVPIDAGAQIGVETPFGLRVFAGYGWVPYLGTLTGIVVNASDRSLATELMRRGHASGDSARFVLGVRPFRRLGVTIDATYARLRLDANLAVPPMTVQGLEFSGGAYAAHTNVDLWGVELGYQAELEQRVVLGAAAGVTGAIDSRTSITPSGAAPHDPALPVAAERVDHAFRTHVVPTVTLRLGFDAI
jgi:hypothetical protein